MLQNLMHGKKFFGCLHQVFSPLVVRLICTNTSIPYASYTVDQMHMQESFCMMSTKRGFSMQLNSVSPFTSPIASSILMEHHCQQCYHCLLSFLLNEPSSYLCQTTAKMIAVLKCLNNPKTMFVRYFRR